MSVLGSLRDLVRELLSPDASDGAPPWAPWVPWEYQVAEATETTFTGRATSSHCPWPDLVGIPLMPGIGGTLIKPAVSSLVLVAFVNGDPSRPRVVSWDQAFAARVAIQSASSPYPQSPTALTVDIAPSGAQIYDAANIPPAQSVALAPAVTSFANAAITVINASSVAMVAVGTFATAVGVATPAVAVAAATLNTAIGVYTSAASSFASTVGGLVGNFPTGFTATKLKTQ